MGGILGYGRNLQSGALSGMQRASALEQEVEARRDQAKALEKQQKFNMMSTLGGLGAGIGAMGVGSSIASATGLASALGVGAGAAAGLATGGLALVGIGLGYLLSEIF